MSDKSAQPFHKVGQEKGLIVNMTGSCYLLIYTWQICVIIFVHRKGMELVLLLFSDNVDTGRRHIDKGTDII